MKADLVRHIPCGPFASESEKESCAKIKAKLEKLQDGNSWILLTNIPFSYQANRLSDEIDLIVLGPSGISIIEIKHWDKSYLKTNSVVAEAEAEKLNNKVKRLASRLKQKFPIDFLVGKFLLTKEAGSLRESTDYLRVRGIPFYSLPDWQDLLDTNVKTQFNDHQIEAICKFIEPQSKIALSGEIRKFANMVNLDRVSPEEDRFHRVYKGLDGHRREKVILHLYDLSATSGKKSHEKAKREYDTLQKFQKSPYLPGLLDSFQDAPNYPGELYYYSIVDPLAPSIETLAKDSGWSHENRLIAARNICKAMDSLHNPDEFDQDYLIHRNINPSNIKYRVDNARPIFTELQSAKLFSFDSISDSSGGSIAQNQFLAPEVKKSGLSVADSRSDTYSICASLCVLFNESQPESKKALDIIHRGLKENPDERINLKDLCRSFDSLITKGSSEESDTYEKLRPEYWHDEYVSKFQNHYYKIISRLGIGGIGQTFKVVHFDPNTKEEYGIFVAKTINDEKDSKACLDAYLKVRSYSLDQNLAAIHEVTPEWNSDEIAALMEWIDGVPLSDLTGVLELHAEDLGEDSLENMCLRWLTQICQGLSALHRVNLVHGDVSPKNIIVSGPKVTLTDYDGITRAGEKPAISSPSYSSPSVQSRDEIVPSDDIYALAASMFHVVYEEEPFRHKTEFRKDLGLNWRDDQVGKWPRLKTFLDKAVSPKRTDRFETANDAILFIKALNSQSSGEQVEVIVDVQKTENTVPRLLDILKTYPGSLKGNEETRGLDSTFAEQTYVETSLDKVILQEIKNGEVSLIILFGNAGDGKTAFLQHLAKELGLPKKHSAERIWQLTLENGVTVKANMDGSASLKGMSATELLDDFFDPFQQLDFPEKLIGLLAINSGPLLEWIENTSAGETPLTNHLSEVLVGEFADVHDRLRFIDLNNRSLVGGYVGDSRTFSTQFPDKLLDAIIGDSTEGNWKPCLSCLASDRCSAWESVKVLKEPKENNVVRKRFFEALQAVHHKGDAHITAREIRATISYIFFGLHYCEDIHSDKALTTGHYYDRAFDPVSKGRQGELLNGLSILDPSLESHPKIDRYLSDKTSINSSPPSYPGLALASARRKAYFEWTAEQVHKVSVDDMFGLAKSRHISRFQALPNMSQDQKTQLCSDVCLGVSGLEDLPQNAFRQSGCPLKITPRTSTETYFWVEKPLCNFSIEVKNPVKTAGLETLHTHLILRYTYVNGETEELLIGADLFNVLMDLKDGFQLSDMASGDTFANLDIFKQRLSQENSREMFAWNPLDHTSVYKLGIVVDNGFQKLVLENLTSEEA